MGDPYEVTIRPLRHGVLQHDRNMTVQVFRKCLSAAESPAALTLGLFGHLTAA